MQGPRGGSRFGRAGLAALLCVACFVVLLIGADDWVDRAIYVAGALAMGVLLAADIRERQRDDRSGGDA